MMSKKRVLFFDVHEYEKPFLLKELERLDVEFEFLSSRLNEKTVRLAKGFDAISSFVNDQLNAPVLDKLHEMGIGAVFLRCAGFNNVDVESAKKNQMTITRVPAYSPEAIAEYTVGLMLSINRKIHRAYNRTREMNFSLEGMVGCNIKSQKVGVVGTGKIGAAVCKILKGFGCDILAYDIEKNPGLDVEYVSLAELFKESDVITLHVPLNAKTKHMINSKSLEEIKPGVLLVNTGRGGLVETKALIKGLKDGTFSGAALDVYEEEENYFFEDLSEAVIDDDLLARLITFPNVLITSHQGFLTKEALGQISRQTCQNIEGFFNDKELSGVIND